jgi:SAM-dependent methyltransferase
MEQNGPGMAFGVLSLNAIVNIPEDLLPTVFGEMWRVLKPGGRLLLSFHIGDQVVRPEELLGQPISMDFFFFRPRSLRTRWKRQGS